LLLITIILFFFAATVFGLIRIGIRFLWVHLYDFQYQNTPPQAVLFACAILIFSVLPLNYTVMLIAPQYSTFGSQQFVSIT